DSSTNKAKLLPAADSACFLCRGGGDPINTAAAEYDRQNMVVLKTPLSITVLNRYPYNNGHLLIAPRRHVARLDELTDDENLDAVKTITRLASALERLMKPEGFNIGLNLGKVAGAGLPGHLHWHVVPRWNGDTNFMPVLAGVNVIPQSLEEL